MAEPFYSTWPETLYALGQTKSITWHAQRSVLELFCAEALLQGVIAGEVACSERDLASHLHRSARSANAAGELLDKLVGRHVLRLVEKGTGTAPSVFAVWHWSRWDVPWKVDRERAADRIAAWFMGGVRAQPGISARVIIRALTTSARSFSQDVSALARGSMDPRASSRDAFSTAQLGASQPARYGAARGAPHLFTSETSSHSLEEGMSEKLRKLEKAVKDATGSLWLTTPLRSRLAYLAAESNGRYDELLARANDPRAPRTRDLLVSHLEEIMREPVPAARAEFCAPPAAWPEPGPDWAADPAIAERNRQALRNLRAGAKVPESDTDEPVDSGS